VVVELRVDELGEVAHAVGFRVLDVLHAAEDVLGGFFVLGLGRAEFLFKPVVVALGLVLLGDAGVVVEAAVLELLARVLE
jgi:hypothetical protein